MRALACGDFHFTERSGLGPERLADFEAVWDQIVDLAIEEDVDALLIAGDVWELRMPTPAELLAFARPLRRLRRESTIDVLAIAGNHCVHHADRPVGLDLFTGLLDLHRQPGIWQCRDVSVCTLPWTPVARLVAEHGGGDRDRLNEQAAELLLTAARGLRAQITGRPAVLLLHWSLSGAALPSGLSIDMAREPILDADELEAMGWDAVIAGHIHRPQIFSEGTWHPLESASAEIAGGAVAASSGTRDTAPILNPNANGNDSGGSLSQRSNESASAPEAAPCSAIPSSSTPATPSHPPGAEDGSRRSPAKSAATPTQKPITTTTRSRSLFAGSASATTSPFTPSTSPIFYCGSPMPLDHGEAACDHGVWLLDVGAKVTLAQFVPLESRRFLTIDDTIVDDHPAGWDEWPSVEDAIVRVRFSMTAEQARRLSVPGIRRALLEAGAWRATVEPTIVREATARVESMTADLDETQALVLWLDAQKVAGDREALLAMHAGVLAEAAL